MNSFEEKLDIIRAGALGMASANSMPEAYNGAGKQILTLIAVVRKQTECLKFYSNFEQSKCYCGGNYFVAKTDEAQKALQECEEMLK